MNTPAESLHQVFLSSATPANLIHAHTKGSQRSFFREVFPSLPIVTIVWILSKKKKHIYRFDPEMFRYFLLYD